MKCPRVIYDNGDTRVAGYYRWHKEIGGSEIILLANPPNSPTLSLKQK